MINLESLTKFIESIFTKEQLFIDRFKADVLIADIDCLDGERKLAIRATFEEIEFSTISKEPEIDFSLYDFALHDQAEAEKLIKEIRRTKKFPPRKLPIWILFLNYASLSGILFYPFTALANYARIGDYSFYQPTSLEYLIIYTYPAILIFVTWLSYKTFSYAKIISAALPMLVIVFYWYLIESGFFFKVVPTNFW